MALQVESAPLIKEGGVLMGPMGWDSKEIQRQKILSRISERNFYLFAHQYNCKLQLSNQSNTTLKFTKQHLNCYTYVTLLFTALFHLSHYRLGIAR